MARWGMGGVPERIISISPNLSSVPWDFKTACMWSSGIESALKGSYLMLFARRQVW